ncbi:MAG TPA: isoprenylcysteine carboxylmethyltransferase family protein [Ktedonobacterales bacterium]
MAANIQDRVQVRIHPPLLFAAPLVLGVLLGLLFPVELLPVGTALIVGGGIAGLGFLGIGMPAFLAMRRARTTLNPNKSSTRLVAGASFRFTRNPLYLGMALGYIGLALMANALWSLLLLPVVLVLMHFLVILPEERNLEQQFGEEYRAYKARVRRWL